MANSVENEWLCMKIASGIGLRAANCEICRFDDVTALVVERFDRRINSDGTSITRLPQEDFCQITGTPLNSKYESDGGPGIETIMSLLLGSQDASKDRESFFMAQVLFWILAAPDGHAKNFSVFIERGGRFRLTPLYDVVSAYPVLGHGNGLIPPEKLKMAMAFRDKNRHFEWDKIHIRHIQESARRCGIDTSAIDAIVSKLSTKIPQTVEMTARSLPKGFPERVADTVFEGIRKRISVLIA
jgi:serine/threonine-protein kinase HipA